jgi:hypothetical protein
MKEFQGDKRANVDVLPKNPAQILQEKLAAMDTGQYFMINDPILHKHFLVLCVNPNIFRP